MNKIERVISVEPITGFKRVARLENFVIQPDLEMVLQIRVVTLNNAGIPFMEAIAADDAINGQREQLMLEKYQDRVYSKLTRGTLVDAGGAVMPEGASGGMAQLAFFQKLTLGQLKSMGVTITDATSLAELMYANLGMQITSIDARGEL